MDNSALPVILVCGMSGAGKSVALKALEDIGYEAVDNLPLGFILPVINSAIDRARPLAIGMDIRSQGFTSEEAHSIAMLCSEDARVRFRFLFLDCEEEILQRRYTETRRKHPLSPDRPLNDGIRQERELLLPVRGCADSVIDTSALTASQLRHRLSEEYTLGRQELSIMVMSFSYRHGLPREADLVFDARFLQNPFYIAALKERDGRDADVAAFIRQDPDFERFFQHLQDLLAPLLRRYRDEGKSYLTLAIGCTGGRHRSVFTAELLAGFLQGLGYKVGLRHRELAGAV